MISRRVRHCALLVTLAGLAGATALADTLVIKGLEYKDSRVVGIEGDFINFDFNGRAQKKPITDITKIVIDNEPAFTAAEAYFAHREWDKATAEYEKAVRGTTKQWIKDWAGVRLLDAAQKGGRFDVVIRNYIQVAEKTPDTARGINLSMPKADSTYLPEAIKAAEAARAKSGNPQAQVVLAKLVVDLYTAKGDNKAAEAAQAIAADIIVRANPNSPEALAALRRLKVAKIQTDLEAGKFDDVINAINAEAPNITEPVEQINLLWALAEARKGKFATSADKDVWKGIAVDYMRVVANGRAVDPKVIDSLLKVAEIHATKLGDKEAAQAMLKRMIDDEYKGMDAARDAEKLLAKLK